MIYVLVVIGVDAFCVMLTANIKSPHVLLRVAFAKALTRGCSSQTTLEPNSPMHRKRETLPDIVRRIPVDSLRPLLKCSLVVAAKVSEHYCGSQTMELELYNCNNCTVHLIPDLSANYDVKPFWLQYGAVRSRVPLSKNKDGSCC